jgi:hypothetical protein
VHSLYSQSRPSLVGPKWRLKQKRILTTLVFVAGEAAASRWQKAEQGAALARVFLFGVIPSRIRPRSKLSPWTNVGCSNDTDSA